jgi:DNA-binding NtrC family response regulator
MNKSCKELYIPPLELSKEALICLKQWNWPGNIRELKNAVKRVCVICADEKIVRPEHFDFLGLRKEHSISKQSGVDGAIEALKNSILSKELPFAEVEDRIVSCILKHFNNNVAEAVEHTGISKNRFYKIKETK